MNQNEKSKLFMVKVIEMNETQFELRLLLHCEGGSPPFLTPHFLQKYFSPKNFLVSQYLSFGIQLRQTCVVPMYGQNKRSNTKRVWKSEKALSTPPISDSNEKIGAIKKPSGYTFVGRPISTHLHIPNGYEIISAPAFDLRDQHTILPKNKGKKSPIAALQSTSKNVVLHTLNGYQKMSPELFLNAIGKLEASSNVGLYDQAIDHIDKDHLYGKKKNQLSIERTKLWTKNYLSKIDENYNGGISNSPSPKIWIPIVGGDDLNYRVDATTDLISQKYENIEGIAFIGLHHITSRLLRNTIMEACLAKAPTIRSSVLATSNLIQIMDAALAGVNLIGSDLPIILAKSKKALVLNLKGWMTDEAREKPEDHDFDRVIGQKSSICIENDEKRTKIPRLHDHENISVKTKSTVNKYGILNLKNTCYVEDVKPLLKGCKCFSCSQGHMRAYIHHLTNVGELLSDILLFLHNLHHLLEFFNELSVAIQSGKGDKFCRYIEQQLEETS